MASPAVWLTIEQLSERLNVPVETLRRWRYHRFGPQATKFGPNRSSVIRYKITEVERWEKECELASGAA